MKKNLYLASALTLVMLSAMPVAAQGEGGSTSTSVNQTLLLRIEKLEAELITLRSAVTESAKTASAAKETAQNAVETVDIVKTLANKNALSAYSGASSDIKFHLTGYADAGFVGSDRPGPGSFTSSKFHPIFHLQYKDILLFETELEFENTDGGDTATDLEFAQVDLLLNDYVTIVAGKFLSPIGRFQEVLHPSWINKIQSKPAGFSSAGFGSNGAQPKNENGIQVRGAIPVGQSKFTYAMMLGNGMQTTAVGGWSRGAKASDNNSNKSVGGRVGFFPLPFLEVGGSYLTSKLDGLPTDGTGGVAPPGLNNTRYKLWGMDGAYTKGPLVARFEYLDSHRGALFSATDINPEGIVLPRFGMEAWYGQVAYRLSNIGGSAFIHNLEPVIRYGEFRVSGNARLEKKNEENRFNVGLNYWLAPSIVTKAGLEWRDYKAAGVDSEMLYQFQFSFGF